ncbi:MAG: PQQ-binding-like beta-propeller repeat protein [Planctomycetia bacterium]|nr:PQQ-binding-like beta-propeller repeat protein [Planctomycetia bacterium]
MSFPRQFALGAVLSLLGAFAAAARGDDLRESLWAAVRNGDAGAIKALLDQGADVNRKNEIGMTALLIACSKGQVDVIKLLVERGADVNARDGIWYQTPLSTAVGRGNAEVVEFLIDKGAADVDAAVVAAAAGGKSAVLQAVLAGGKVGQEALDAALFSAPRGNEAVQEALAKAGAAPLPPLPAEQREAWKPLEGAYENDNGMKLTIELVDTALTVKRPGFSQPLRPIKPDTFVPLGLDAMSYSFARQGDEVARVILRTYTAEVSFYRLKSKLAANPRQAHAEEAPFPIGAPLNWPSFRGPDASGVADGQHPPLSWDVANDVNVRWKTEIPGLGHSCPVIWGDRVFLTTAVSADADPKVRTGNYGDVASVNDTSQHSWQVFCLDRDSGNVLWSRTACEGVPKIKRHLKGSQANCTPATDGKRLVVCFASEGLYCYDVAGELLWRRELGTLDSGIKLADTYEWGFGSSPIIYEDLVILQCDLAKDSFLAAYRLADGSPVWSTPRDEIPSWSTPAVWRNSQRVELVTNAAQYARGYDPATGKELWRLAKKSEITIPTPVFGPELLFITSGNRPIQPIFAIKPGATGDISLEGNQSVSSYVAWSKMRGGPYMPTPIFYSDYLYTCGNGGIVTCYEAQTGKEVYKQRLGGESYTASPIAADERLYFTSEQGLVQVLKAGPEFELLAVNEMGDVCMATPAISAGMLFVRSQHFLFALGAQPRK